MLTKYQEPSGIEDDKDLMITNSSTRSSRYDTRDNTISLVTKDGKGLWPLANSEEHC